MKRCGRLLTGTGRFKQNEKRRKKRLILADRENRREIK